MKMRDGRMSVRKRVSLAVRLTAALLALAAVAASPLGAVEKKDLIGVWEGELAEDMSKGLRTPLVLELFKDPESKDANAIRGYAVGTFFVMTLGDVSIKDDSIEIQALDTNADSENSEGRIPQKPLLKGKITSGTEMKVENRMEGVSGPTAADRTTTLKLAAHPDALKLSAAQISGSYSGGVHHIFGKKPEASVPVSVKLEITDERAGGSVTIENKTIEFTLIQRVGDKLVLNWPAEGALAPSVIVGKFTKEGVFEGAFSNRYLTGKITLKK